MDTRPITLVRLVWSQTATFILGSDFPVFSDSNSDGYTRSLFVHETMATDTDNIKKVFGDVKVTVFTNTMKDIMY